MYSGSVLSEVRVVSVTVIVFVAVLVTESGRCVCDLLDFVDSSDLNDSDDEQDLSSSPRLGTPSSAQQPKEFSPASPTGPPLPGD